VYKLRGGWRVEGILLAGARKASGRLLPLSLSSKWHWRLQKKQPCEQGSALGGGTGPRQRSSKKCRELEKKKPKLFLRNGGLLGGGKTAQTLTIS